MTPTDFVDLLARVRVSAILRATDSCLAGAAMDAAVRGGFRVIEFTLTTPGALELIREFSAREGLVVGAGTVLEVERARAAVEAGARFLVSPVVDEAIISAAAALGVAAMPGAHTPTEMLRAHRAGAPLVKLFPEPAGGPRWLAAVLGPLPELKVVPTNGVDADNLPAWIRAGAHAAGFVGSLFDPGELRAGDLAAIEARAARIVACARGL